MLVLKNNLSTRVTLIPWLLYIDLYVISSSVLPSAGHAAFYNHLNTHVQARHGTLLYIFELQQGLFCLFYNLLPSQILCCHSLLP